MTAVLEILVHATKQKKVPWVRVKVGQAPSRLRQSSKIKTAHSRVRVSYIQ